MEDKLKQQAFTLANLAEVALQEGGAPADWLVVLARHLAVYIFGMTQEKERQERIMQSFASLVDASLEVLKHREHLASVQQQRRGV